MPGWEAASTPLMLFFVPVKGMLFFFLPQVWAVWANLLMIRAPFEVKRVEEGKGSRFALLSLIAASIPVGLVLSPRALNLGGVREFLIGFDLWAISLIAASAWFLWAVWRRWTVLLPSAVLVTMLVVGLSGWSPILKDEAERQAQERENDRKQQRVQQQRHAENAALAATLTQRGVLAFSEPMSPQEESALEEYLSSARVTPEELIAASEHYQTPAIMETLASRPITPPKALEILFDHATAMDKASAGKYMGRVYREIGQNPNAPQELLVKMLHSEIPTARPVVLSNPKLPLKEKTAYLERGCSLSDADFNAIAGNADTPVSVLECLSTKPAARYGVAGNPNTPLSLLEQMSQSTDWSIANEAKVALAHRRSMGH